MLPIILLAGAAGLYWHHKKTAPASQIVATPKQAYIHGCLMGQEFNPSKLEEAAGHFSRKGLKQEAKDLRSKADQVKKQIQGAVELCERARKNDQNAIGMIAAIREQAKTGNPRAVLSACLIERYCIANPAPELGPHGEVPIGQTGTETVYGGWVPARAA